jgi:hypothetical protein
MDREGHHYQHPRLLPAEALKVKEFGEVEYMRQALDDALKHYLLFLSCTISHGDRSASSQPSRSWGHCSAMNAAITRLPLFFSPLESVSNSSRSSFFYLM